MKFGRIAATETTTIPADENSDAFFVWEKALPITLKMPEITSVTDTIRIRMTRHQAGSFPAAFPIILNSYGYQTAMPAIARSHPKMSEAPIHSKSGTLR